MKTNNTTQTAVPTVRRWACLVGVNQYVHMRPLQFCVNDASELHDLLVSSLHSGYVPERARLLLGEANDSPETMRLSILKQLQDIASKALPEDMLLFYFAGHGQYTDGEVYLLTADTEPGVLIPDTAVPLTRVTKILDSSQARAKVIILDACYTGVPLRFGLARRSLGGPDSEMMEMLLIESEGTAILSSAARSDAAFEWDEEKHGVFTYYLLEGMRGAANRRPDGSITVNEVHQYVSERTRRWAKQHGHSMRPTMEFRGSGELTLITTAFSASRPLDSSVQSPVLPAFPPGFNPDAWLAPLRNPWPGWVGRAAEIKRVQDHIFETTDLAILVKGDPRVGKTSFLNRVQHGIETNASQLSHRFICTSVATGDLSSCEGFAGGIYNGLVHSIDPKHLQIEQEPFILESFGAFGAQLGRVQALAPDTTFVVFLDEYDRILDQCSELEQKRINGLIRYLIEGTPFPVVFFLTVTRDLPSDYPSPNFPLTKLTLHFFDQAETNALVSGLLQPYVHPTDAELARIFEYTGGHPYLTRLLVAKLFDLGPWTTSENGIGQERIEQAVNAAIASDRAHLLLKGVYSSLRDDDQRRVLLQYACSNRQPISLSEIDLKLHASVKQLASNDYLAKVEDDVYGLRVRFAIDWLCQWDDFSAEVDRLDIRCERLPGQEEADRAPVGGIPGDGIYVDRATQRVYVEGKEIDTPLTDLQYRALVLLSRKSGDVVSYDDLARELWPSEFYDPGESMDNQRIPTLISRLRLALNDRRKPYKYLITLPKRGYRLENATLS